MAHIKPVISKTFQYLDYNLKCQYYLICECPWLTLKFSECYKRPSEGNTTNVCSQEEGGLQHVNCGVSGEVGLLVQEVSNTCNDSSSTNKTVEQRHHLGQICHFNFLPTNDTNRSTWKVCKWLLLTLHHIHRIALFLINTISQNQDYTYSNILL